MLTAAFGFYVVWHIRRHESPEQRHALTDGKAFAYAIAGAGVGMFIAAIR